MSSDEEYGSEIAGSDLSEWESEAEVGNIVKPKFNSLSEEREWERKQRLREYRVAARREKRNRKADEKKQRKLNAQILRRMTKNPEKYNKNANRNRLRDIQLERRNVQREAILQAERLAAVHDPSGRMFNVGPVITQEDGKVVSVEALERRRKAQAEKEERAAQIASGVVSSPPTSTIHNGVNPDRQQLIQTSSNSNPAARTMSKTQQRKLALLEDRPAPPKPVIPAGIDLPEGEENWLALWDLDDDGLERRVIQEKKRKAAERKALREKQKEGKVERRAARDERRKVYREKKLEWKAIKEAEKIQKRQILRVEQEEAKRIETEVNIAERRRAMEVCAELGFTLNNVEGVSDIKPRALGMGGREIDFDSLQIGDRPSELKINGKAIAQQPVEKKNSKRVDLGRAADESKLSLYAPEDDVMAGGLDDDFVSFGDLGKTPTNGQSAEELNFNHKLRRKLHRAVEFAQIKKELLVRAKAVEHCKANGIEVPTELANEYKPIKLDGRRVLEDGTIETEKQERVRKRLELAEYNKAAKVLRQQAKAEAIEAGLRVFAELTGQKQPQENQALATDSDGNIKTLPGITIANEASNKRQRTTDDGEHRQPKKSKKSNGADFVGKRSGDSQVPTSKAESKGEEVANIPTVSTGSQEVSEEAARRERKRLRKERKSKDLTKNGHVTIDDSEGEKSTKSKSLHKELTPEHKVNGNSAEQWNANALDGDPARKDKFLRLLGGGKTNGSKTTGAKSSKKDSNIKQIESDLERQFEAGVRMKHDGQSRRKGLGA